MEMTRTQLLSTAAALMLSAGTALAQAPAPSKDQAPAQPAPAAQQSAPAEKIAPPADRKASETKAPDAKSGPTQAQKSGAPTTAADSGKADMKTPPAAGKAEMKGAAEPNKAAADTTKAAPATTTGQGAAGSARLSTEQRSKITTVIRQQKVQPVKLNVSISVGTRVPSSVHYYPLPREVVVIYPEWRGYDYILVGDQIVIIDPRSHEIVAILEA
jgi:hypothetical protein